MVDCRIDPRLKLYEDLNSELNVSEEKSIRTLISDKIPKRELDQLCNVADILKSLEEKGYIKVPDLSLIKELLKQINRRPLLSKVYDCEKKLKLYQNRAPEANTGENDNPQSDSQVISSKSQPMSSQSQSEAQNEGVRIHPVKLLLSSAVVIIMGYLVYVRFGAKQ